MNSSRSSRRLHGSIIVIAASLLTTQAFSQPIVLHSPSETYNGQFGLSVGKVPDTNGDGANEVITGAPGEFGFTGRAYLYDGFSGELLRTFLPRSSEGFGQSVGGVPDASGDGKGDVVVGSINGRATLLDGNSGDVLHELANPNGGGTSFGFAVAGIPDCTGDGRGDVVVGAYTDTIGGTSRGKAFVYDGATGNLKWTLQAPAELATGNFGWSVSGIGDVTGDSLGDVLVGEIFPGGVGAGYIFNGATGTFVHRLVPTEGPASETGYCISDAPDFTGDGIPDVVVGSGLGRRAYQFNGSTGEHVRTLESPFLPPAPPYTSYYALSVSGVVDVNNDGHGDVLVGSPYENPEHDKSVNGYAFIYDGANGNLLHEFKLDVSDDRSSFGSSLVSLGDTDGDHRGDFAVGAYTHLVDGTDDITSGRAFLFESTIWTPQTRSASGLLRFLEVTESSDVNGDLIVDAADIVATGLATN